MQAISLLKKSTTLQLLNEPICILLSRIEETINADIEKLCDGNRERVFTSTSNILAKGFEILSAASDRINADMLVCSRVQLWQPHEAQCVRCFCDSALIAVQ
jgi:hypothetical protein